MAWEHGIAISNEWCTHKKVHFYQLHFVKSLSDGFDDITVINQCPVSNLGEWDLKRDVRMLRNLCSPISAYDFIGLWSINLSRDIFLIICSLLNNFCLRSY